MTQYLILSLLWGAWCFLHSFMISRSINGLVQKRFERTYPYYRIFFNVVSLVTLVPVLAYAHSIRGPAVFQWEGGFRIIQGLLVVSAILFFVGGGSRYDLAQFLGMRQVRDDNTCTVLKEDCRLDTGGILGMVRHPWYAGGMLIVWARDLDVTAILSSLVMTGYFVVGAYLEERKLVAEFGDEYREYQARVSMLFPFRWALQKLRR
jgi:protein-S-isoprenylcysteine O-methyltransferase Ste14